MRVHELAKKLGLTNKDLITLMEDAGMTGKTHSSGLEPNQIAEIEAHAKAKKAGKSAGGGAKGGGGATLQAPRPAPRPISRPTTPSSRSRGGGPTPSSPAPAEGLPPRLGDWIARAGCNGC
jgi:translation initiation factor IF-2